MFLLIVSVGDLALRNNRHNGDQYKNDETLGNYHYVFQLRLCLHTRIAYGYGGMLQFLNSTLIRRVINLCSIDLSSDLSKDIIAETKYLLYM